MPTDGNGKNAIEPNFPQKCIEMRKFWSEKGRVGKVFSTILKKANKPKSEPDILSLIFE